MLYFFAEILVVRRVCLLMHLKVTIISFRQSRMHPGTLRIKNGTRFKSSKVLW